MKVSANVLPTAEAPGVFFGHPTRYEVCDCGCEQPTAVYVESGEMCYVQSRLLGHRFTLDSVQDEILQDHGLTMQELHEFADFESAQQRLNAVAQLFLDPDSVDMDALPDDVQKKLFKATMRSMFAGLAGGTLIVLEVEGGDEDSLPDLFTPQGPEDWDFNPNNPE